MQIKEIEKLILNTYEQVRVIQFKHCDVAIVIGGIAMMVSIFLDSLPWTLASIGLTVSVVIYLNRVIMKKKSKRVNTVLQELMKKIEAYEDILNNSLLSDKSVDIVKFYEILKINEIINKNKKLLMILDCSDSIFNKLESITKNYQNYILQNNPKEFEVQVNCNFSDVSVLYCSEKNIIDLLTYEGFDVFDMIDNRISYQNDLVKKNLHKSLNLNNIKYIENIFNNFPDKQKIIIDFLISVKDGVFDKNQSAIIKKMLGSSMYDIFEKSNTIDRCTHDSVILLQLSDTVAFIVNNLEKLPQKAKIDFDFIKKDYEKAQSLDLLKTQECKSIFENKFKSFIDIINSNEIEKQEQLKFMKYLSKAL